MNWQEALEEIQSVEFDVNLNVVSSTNGFFRAVAKEPAVLEAYRQMRESGELREEVLGRIFDLASREIDLCYQHPNDTPLSVLLWLTYFAAGDFAPMAAAAVARAPNCWYARKLARRILNPPPSSTENHRVGDTSVGRPIAAISSANATFTMAPPTVNLSKVLPGKPRATATALVSVWNVAGEPRTPLGNCSLATQVVS